MNIKDTDLSKLQWNMKCHWKVQSTFPDKKDNTKYKCSLVAYIEAKEIRDLLDGEIWIANWQNKIERQNGMTICTLSIKVDGEWISKSDVWDGSKETWSWDNKKITENMKASATDAFKRAAAMWGIWSFLKDKETVYLGYDKTGKNPLDADWKQLKNEIMISKYINDNWAKVTKF